VMCDAARRIARRGAALNASLGRVTRSRLGCFDFKDTDRTEIAATPPGVRQALAAGIARRRNLDEAQVHVVAAIANNGALRSRCRACIGRATERASSAWQSGDERSRTRSALPPSSC